jgi:hypothetical protein
MFWCHYNFSFANWISRWQTWYRREGNKLSKYLSSLNYNKHFYMYFKIYYATHIEWKSHPLVACSHFLPHGSMTLKFDIWHPPASQSKHVQWPTQEEKNANFTRALHLISNLPETMTRHSFPIWRFFLSHSSDTKPHQKWPEATGALQILGRRRSCAAVVLFLLNICFGRHLILSMNMNKDNTFFISSFLGYMELALASFI